MCHPIMRVSIIPKWLRDACDKLANIIAEPLGESHNLLRRGLDLLRLTMESV